MKNFAVVATLVLSFFMAIGPVFAQDQPPSQSKYIKDIFQGPVPAERLTFLNRFSGAPVKDLAHDKQFHQLMHEIVPDCLFHYGMDMKLTDALDSILKESAAPVQLRDSRYLLVSSQNSPKVRGRAFLWFDLQDGIGLGGLYFNPTNGEPSPTLTVFSRQIRTQSLSLGQLPPAFAQDMQQWSHDVHAPALTTRYFITGSNEKILLEHDEFDCAPGDAPAARPGNVCEQMNLDAADVDMNAAYYLEQTGHATNATARMITGEEQRVWMGTRESSCRIAPDPFRCRVSMTRVHIHGIIHTSPSHHK